MSVYERAFFAKMVSAQKSSPEGPSYADPWTNDFRSASLTSQSA